MAELREMCGEMRMPTAGGKAALVVRILTKLQAAGEEEDEEEEEDADADADAAADDADEYTDDDDAKEDQESPFDWEAMSAADDDDDDDGGDYDMPPRLVTFVYLQDCPANPNPDPEH